MIPVPSINDPFFSMFSGLYPGDHNIIANQFADENSSDKKYFDKNNEETTGHLKWWHNNEPIWATANKNHKNFSTFLWSRCDVAYHDRHTIEPTFCENMYRKDESKTLSLNLEMATIHFQQGNTQAAMVSIVKIPHCKSVHGSTRVYREIPVMKAGSLQ